MRLPSFVFVIALVAACDGPPPPPKAIGGEPPPVLDAIVGPPSDLALPEGDGALALRAEDAVVESEPTTALVVKWRVPSEVAERYGASLPRALLVVAVQPEAHRAWLGNLAPDVDGPMPEDPGAPMPEGARVADLRRLLGLPSHAQHYDVFLWLDALTSEVLRVDLPAGEKTAPSRSGLPISGAVRIAEPANTLAEEQDQAPEAASNGTASNGTAPEVTLEARATDLGRSTTRPETAVSGIVRPPADDRPPLLLFAQSRPGMRVGWARTILPLPAEAAHAFEVDARHLFFDQDPAGSVWALAWIAGARSAPVTLTLPAEREAVADEAADDSQKK